MQYPESVTFYKAQLTLARSYEEQVSAMRDFVRRERSAGRSAHFQRAFGVTFYGCCDRAVVQQARQNVNDILATFSVPSVASVMSVGEDRFVIDVKTERYLTEEEDMALPMTVLGIPVEHGPVVPFASWVAYSVGGKRPTP